MSAIEQFARWRRKNTAWAATLLALATALILVSLGAVVAADDYRRMEASAA